MSMRNDSPVGMISAFGRDSVVMGAADARSGDSPPPDYSSLFGDRRYSTCIIYIYTWEFLIFLPIFPSVFIGEKFIMLNFYPTCMLMIA